MQLRLTGGFGLAALMLTGMAFAPGARAQGVLFSGTSDRNAYGLLNDDNLALYIDRLGDLGAPTTNLLVTKPGGDYVNNQPFINPDGSVNQSTVGTVNSRTYGALYNPNSTGSITPIGSSVQAKQQEYITVGPSQAAAGWGIRVGGTWIPYTSLTSSLTSFAVNGSTSSGQSGTFGGALSATSTFALNSTLTLTQSTYLNVDPTTGQKLPANEAKFDVVFKNTGTTALNGLAYSFMLNPNQGQSPDGGSHTNTTNQKYGTTNPNAFAINSEQNGLNMGLGVLPSDQTPNSGEVELGSRIFSTSITSESGVLGNPEFLIDGLNNANAVPYVMLNSDGSASAFDPTVDPFNPTETIPFTGQFTQNPFLTGADDSLVLISPDLNVAAGGSASFSFYLFFNPPNGGPTVPEPGAVALLFGSAISFGGLLLRRRTRK